MSPSIDWRAVERHWNCRLTTTGRKSGRPRSVTIWYATGDGRIYLTGSEHEPHWCRNLRAHPDCTIRIGSAELRGRARVVEDEGEARSVRERFVRRYLLARLARPFGGYSRSVAVVIEDLAPAGQG
jgi:deazaflavin-dependent oxidoreductase (nitroreductase family)